MMDRLKHTLSNWLSKFSESRHTGIYIFLWSFIFTVAVSSFVTIPPVVSVLVLVIVLGIYSAEKVYRGVVSKDIFFLLLLLAALSLGTLRYAIKDFHETLTPVTTGIVAREPEHRDSDTRFVFESDNGERVLVSTDLASQVQYSDRVEIEGKLKSPGVIVDDVSGREFDYGAYLSKDDIYWTESFAKVTRLTEMTSPTLGQASGQSRSMSSRLVSVLLTVKHSFENKIKSILPEPEASLLAGLIVAGKEALPGNILDDFKHAGVVHIVVLSGYNVTIIAEFFLLLLGFLGTRRAALGSAIGITLFTLMTGATATVVRAAIMVLALLVGKVIGRPYHAGRILLFTACFMLVWNPKYLIFDPSFQLSFLAMLALVYVTPIVCSLLAKVKMPAQLAELVSITIATQLTALPFLLYSVGNISIVSIFTNILILVFVPVTMLIGFIAVLLAYVSTILAWPLAFVTHLLLAYILGVAHFFGNLPFASISASLPAWGMITCYIFLLGIVTTIYRSNKFSLKQNATIGSSHNSQISTIRT